MILFFKGVFYATALFVYWQALIPFDEGGYTLGWDKANHTLAFFVLATQAFFAFPRAKLFQLFLWLVLFAITIELSQALTAYRQPSCLDVLADIIGLLLVWLFLPLLTRCRGWLTLIWGDDR